MIREESVGGSLKNRRHNRRSVILPDISIGSVEEILISVQLVLQERPPEFLLHEALALRGVLPVGEANFLHNGSSPQEKGVGIELSGENSKLFKTFALFLELLFRGYNDACGREAARQANLRRLQQLRG